MSRRVATPSIAAELNLIARNKSSAAAQATPFKTPLIQAPAASAMPWLAEVPSSATTTNDEKATPSMATRLIGRKKSSAAPSTAATTDNAKATFEQLTSLRLLHSMLSREAAPSWRMFSAQAAKKYPHVNLVGVRAKLEGTGVVFLSEAEREKVIEKQAVEKKRQSELEAKKKAEEEARKRANELFKQTLDARVLYTDLVKARGGVEPTWRQFAAEIEKTHKVKVGTELQRQLMRVPGIVFMTKQKALALYDQEIKKMEQKQLQETNVVKTEFLKKQSGLMARHNVQRKAIESRHEKLMESLREDGHPTDKWWARDPRYVVSMKREQSRQFAKTAMAAVHNSDVLGQKQVKQQQKEEKQAPAIPRKLRKAMKN